MIFLRISGNNEQTIERIGEFLLKEKLLIDLNVKRNIERWVLFGDEIVKEKISLLTAKTKAVLFDEIDDLIRKHYPNDRLEIYSLPIVHMDWEDAQHIKHDVKTKENAID